MRGHALDVYAQSLLEVLLDVAKHLVGLVNHHRPPFEPEVFAQRSDTGTVQPGDKRPTQVDRYPIRRPAGQTVEDTLT
ncbi:MAG: hypothetical protein AAF333_06240 [Planctomycetota bacterium]